MAESFTIFQRSDRTTALEHSHQIQSRQVSVERISLKKPFPKWCHRQLSWWCCTWRWWWRWNWWCRAWPACCETVGDNMNGHSPRCVCSLSGLAAELAVALESVGRHAGAVVDAGLLPHRPRRPMPASSYKYGRLTHALPRQAPGCSFIDPFRGGRQKPMCYAMLVFDGQMSVATWNGGWDNYI